MKRDPSFIAFNNDVKGCIRKHFVVLCFRKTDHEFWEFLLFTVPVTLLLVFQFLALLAF